MGFPACFLIRAKGFIAGGFRAEFIKPFNVY